MASASSLSAARSVRTAGHPEPAYGLGLLGGQMTLAAGGG